MPLPLRASFLSVTNKHHTESRTPELGDTRVIENHLCGDCNADGTVDLSDAIFSLYFQFQLDVSDPPYILSYQFTDGLAPLAPFPACDTAGPEDDCVEDICKK